MLQSVSFLVAGTEVEGILHLPDGETLGGVAVLGGRGGDIEAGAGLCTAIERAGVAALRFTWRAPDDIKAALADVAAAIRLLRAHPSVPQRAGVVGHSYGGAVAAIAAGRDSRLRAAVLIVPPAERDYFGGLRPMAELSRTRARVLIVGASADEVVAPGDAERYAVLLRQAGVTHRLVMVEGADHQFFEHEHREQAERAITDWLRQAFAA